MASYDTNELIADLYPFFRIYKNNQVERLHSTLGLAYVPPSLEDPATGVSSKDVTISPHLSARLYLPNTTQKLLPILVYYHGGALVLGSAFFNAYHRYINILASESNAIAVSVEYRLAPENDVATIYEDSWTALQWVANCSDPWLKDHGDFSRLCIAGDSAGGNIVYHLAMRAGIAKSVTISGSILAFPYFLVPLDNIEENLAYKIWVAISPASEAGVHSPMINPLAEKSPSLCGLGCSRLLLCVGEKDEWVPPEVGVRFSEGVKQSGWKGDLELIEVEGEGHCFQLVNPESDKARHFIKRIANFIQNK